MRREDMEGLAKGVLLDAIGEMADMMRRRARWGTWDGRAETTQTAYFESCRRLHSPTGTILIFTRDTGHHTSGWMRNPDYERCLHLSLSFVDERLQPRPRDCELSRLWIRAFFRDDLRYVWAESPKTEHGKQYDVWHWRLFCDPAWNAILPRGEVYSTDFTEKGWRSASQVLEEDGVAILSPVDPGVTG